MTLDKLRQTFNDKLDSLGDNHKAITSFCIDTLYMIQNVPYLQDYKDITEFKGYVRSIRGASEMAAYSAKWKI